MKRILIPVDGSPKILHAAKAVVAECNGGVERTGLALPALAATV